MDNRATGQFWSDDCMICGEPALDADEIEAANSAPNFNPVDSLWVYCRSCDCWTGHPALTEAPHVN